MTTKTLNIEEQNCPICKSAMKTTERGGHKVDGCLNCGGLYLKKGELNAITPHHHTIFSTEDLELSSIDHEKHKDVHGDIPCIYCDNKKMIKINFLQMSDIILDYCEDCGSIWLDGGELEKVHKYWDKIKDTFEKIKDPLLIQFINFAKAVFIH